MYDSVQTAKKTLWQSKQLNTVLALFDYSGKHKFKQIVLTLIDWRQKSRFNNMMLCLVV